ncbi:hypothetical protein CN270_09330 [Priestia megaterium]|uniref:hypothetical protein n=1 Tax=Priestia megaterium TaxID=1404 RepID=UPI000BF7C109|nr:hypothetical protein [Priestia megaterium]PFE34886.1 hypothetical protein CN270_09330 [Priestia megaterium]
MTAYLNYVFNQTSSQTPTIPNKELFISQPPGPAILVWTNTNVFPNLTGVSVVSELNSVGMNSNSVRSTNLISNLSQTITNTGNQNRSTLPFLDIKYDFPNDLLIINGTNYTVTTGGDYIATQFNLSTTGSRTKSVNSSTSVTDPFHIWSRDFFSGSMVKKLDIDMASYDSSNNTFTGLFEIKRSANSNFNNWQPYTDDKPNYEMVMALADELNIPFHTIHHNEVQERVIDESKLVNVYSYTPQAGQSWNDFRSFNNRQQVSAKQTLALL